MSRQELIINGRRRAFSSGDLLVVLAGMDVSADTRGVAVAVNGTIIPRDRWSEVELKPGDEIDVVGAVQGG